MKKILVVALLSLTISGIAQEKKNQVRADRVEYTPQQRTELQVKKLTLELDLTAKQQKEIAEIVANQQAKRQAMKTEMQNKRAENKKLTADEKFVLKNKALDERIAMKSQMKKILTPEQLEKWENMPKRNMKKEKHHMKRKAAMKN